jgi:carbon storage regulator CsrA
MMQNEVSKAGPTLTRLVLSRKAGERVAIGDDIVVEVVRQTARRTVLAIVAPSDVSIKRSELLERLVAAAIAESGGPLAPPEQTGQTAQLSAA